MKKVITLIILFLIFFTSSPLQANEATESSSAETLTNKIKEKLQETAETGLDNIKNELVSKSKTPKKKAYIGQVKTLEDNHLTLEYKSQIYQATINQSTNITKSAGNKNLQFEDLKIEDFLIVMGFTFPDQTDLSAHKVLLIVNPETPTPRQLLSGKIKEIDGNKVSIESRTLILSPKTDLKIKDIKDPKVEDLELDDNLFAIVTLDQNGDIHNVKNILVLPGKNNPAALEPTNLNEATDSSKPE